MAMRVSKRWLVANPALRALWEGYRIFLAIAVGAKGRVEDEWGWCLETRKGDGLQRRGEGLGTLLRGRKAENLVRRGKVFGGLLRVLRVVRVSMETPVLQ